MVLNKIFKQMKWNLCSLPYIKKKTKKNSIQKNKTISRKLYIIIKAKRNLYKFKLKKYNIWNIKEGTRDFVKLINWKSLNVCLLELRYKMVI